MSSENKIKKFVDKNPEIFEEEEYEEDALIALFGDFDDSDEEK